MVSSGSPDLPGWDIFLHGSAGVNIVDKDEVYLQVREYSAKSPDGPRFMQWFLESCTWSLSPAPGFVNTFCPYLAGLISGH